MGTRRILFALLATGILVVGVGVPYAYKAPAPSPQPVLAADPAEGRTLQDELDELVRSLPLRPPPTQCYNREMGSKFTEDEERALVADLEAQQRLLDQMQATMATIPPPPGYDPTNPLGVVNIHRRVTATPCVVTPPETSPLHPLTPVSPPP